MRREDTFPFWIMTLREYYIWLIDNNGEQTPELKRYKASLNPGDAGDGKCNSSFNSDWAQRYGNGGFHFQGQTAGSRNLDTYFIRILPPMGWLSLSDMMVSIPLNRWDAYRNDVSYRKYTHTNGITYDIGPKEIFDREIVFVKKDPLYAIPCSDMYVSYELDNGTNGKPCESEFGVYPVQVGTNLFLNPKSQQKDRWTQQRATCYKLTSNNEAYVAPGSRWGYWFDGPSIWGSHTIQLYAAVNRVYLETISYRINKIYDKWYYDGGALLANSDGTKQGCKYSAWSSVAYYNRDGKKNGNIIDESADATIDPGVLRYTSVFLPSWGEYENEWGDSFYGDGAARILYLLHFDTTNKLCCSPGAILGDGECGFGTNRVSPGSTQCADLYRKTCKFDSPEFTTNYCLKNGCRANVKDSQNLIVCDYELKKFCNDIEDPAGPATEKNKLMTKLAPYKAKVELCNYQDEAKRIREASFSDYKYTTDKRSIYSTLCGLDWRTKRLNKTTGAIEDIPLDEQQRASNSGQNLSQLSSDFNKIASYGGATSSQLNTVDTSLIDPRAFEYNYYCKGYERFEGITTQAGRPTASQIKKAFETADKDEKACADAKVVADEFNKRMSFYDKKLENIRRSKEIGRNVNQILYPDMCACFASTKDLKGDCDAIADTMKIRNNKPAKKVLNIDTDDPLQCNQNCAVNPLCRVQTVPDKQGYPREGRTVMQGFIQDKSKCEDKNICVQTATINNEGKIGKLTISQDANCSAYKSKFCQNSVLSKCDTQNGQGLFVKRVIEEKDGGTCTTNLDSLQCAKINLTPTFDVCTNGIRTTRYKQELTDKVNDEDIIDALKTLLTPEMKESNPLVKYTKETRNGEIYTDCQDCEMGFETTSGCYLEDGKWKVRATKTKVLAQPKNKGKACVVDNSVQVTDCTADKDCMVSVKTPDDGCVSGKRSMTFNIDSFSSGNGKTCENAVLEKVPQLFKDNAVSVSISGRVATASIPCRDCVVDYKLDPTSNNGKCYFDGTKNVIKKIPFIKRQALNGGKCDVKLDVPLIEVCKDDQNCVFNDEPLTTSSGCINGEKTLEFEVKIPPSNNGRSCSDVGKTFGSKYTKDTSKNEFLNNKLYIKTSCEKPQDCEIENIPYQKGCDINTGKGVELYKILTPQKNGGKTCTEVFEETIETNIDISEDNEKIIVNKPCMGISTLKGSIMQDIRIRYGIIAVIVLLILMLLLKVF
jgi:hypothetical protein